jgi:hypothetical protein
MGKVDVIANILNLQIVNKGTRLLKKCFHNFILIHYKSSFLDRFKRLQRRCDRWPIMTRLIYFATG